MAERVDLGFVAHDSAVSFKGRLLTAGDEDCLELREDDESEKADSRRALVFPGLLSAVTPELLVRPAWWIARIHGRLPTGLHRLATPQRGLLLSGSHTALRIVDVFGVCGSKPIRLSGEFFTNAFHDREASWSCRLERDTSFSVVQ